ncbi:hypothetical protein SAMN05216525_13859 [Bradyrhizobium sp. Gha]|nr:hypothetical protein SAMN05216525_13859 [Bradyrhizobium sp. Gha]
MNAAPPSPASTKPTRRNLLAIAAAERLTKAFQLPEFHRPLPFVGPRTNLKRPYLSQSDLR